MHSTDFTPSQLDEIVQKTIDEIEKGKKQIFEISETARSELGELEQKLEQIKARVKEVIDEIEHLEILEKKSRRRLMVVSKNFNQYSEEDIKNAYDTTKDLQVKLARKREQEQQLITQRTELELRIRRVKETVERAEYLVRHVAVAMNYLTGALRNIRGALEELKNKELMGMQIILAQEEERQRVARDIHDGPAQSMSNIVLKSEICEKLIDIDINKARHEIKELKELVRASLKEIRRIIYDLRPMSLDDLGLVPALQQYISNYEKETGLHVALDLYNQEEKLESFIEVAVFRIIQEALNNVKKHAKASRVYIKLRQQDGKLIGVIKDNGVGFDIEKLQQNNRHDFDKRSRFGIYGMRQRVELLNGRFEIKSRKKKGTTVKIEIPLNSRRRDNKEG